MHPVLQAFRNGQQILVNPQGQRITAQNSHHETDLKGIVQSIEAEVFKPLEEQTRNSGLQFTYNSLPLEFATGPLKIGNLEAFNRLSQRSLHCNVYISKYSDNSTSLVISPLSNCRDFNISFTKSDATRNNLVLQEIAQQIYKFFKADLLVSFVSDSPNPHIKDNEELEEQLDSSPFLITAPLENCIAESFSSAVSDPETQAWMFTKRGHQPFAFTESTHCSNPDQYYRDLALLKQKLREQSKT
jgi:hypothetical protein